MLQSSYRNWQELAKQKTKRTSSHTNDRILSTGRFSWQLHRTLHTATGCHRQREWKLRHVPRRIRVASVVQVMATPRQNRLFLFWELSVGSFEDKFRPGACVHDSYPRRCVGGGVWAAFRAFDHWFSAAKNQVEGQLTVGIKLGSSRYFPVNLTADAVRRRILDSIWALRRKQ